MRPHDGTRYVAVLLFDEVEVLDFAGPFEVFGVTGQRDRPVPPFDVYTVAGTREVVQARNGLAVTPRYALADAPPPHVLVVPGGYGTRRAMHDPVLVGWIAQHAPAAEVVLSVCTGALLLARAGLLAGREVTTHHMATDLLRDLAAGARVVSGPRFVDTGHVVTAAGISAGIDAALHVVRRLLGEAAARETAAYMEYRWEPGP